MAINLLFLDYDDTLFPTTVIKKQKDENINLDELDKQIYDLLNKLTNLCKCCILTNASVQWYSYSINKYMPLTANFIQNGEICFISARNLYEKEFDSPILWKLYAMNNLIKNYLDSSTEIDNIISIGDSNIDRDAFYMLDLSNYNCNKKYIKLLDNPTINVIKKQIDIIDNNIEMLFSWDTTFEISLCSNFDMHNFNHLLCDTSA